MHAADVRAVYDVHVDLLIRMFRHKRLSRCYGLTTMRAQVMTRREARGGHYSSIVNRKCGWTVVVRRLQRLAIVQMSVCARQLGFSDATV